MHRRTPSCIRLRRNTDIVEPNFLSCFFDSWLCPTTIDVSPVAPLSFRRHVTVLQIPGTYLPIVVILSGIRAPAYTARSSPSSPFPERPGLYTVYKVHRSRILCFAGGAEIVGVSLETTWVSNIVFQTLGFKGGDTRKESISTGIVRCWSCWSWQCWRCGGVGGQGKRWVVNIYQVHFEEQLLTAFADVGTRTLAQPK